jgi:hypothetical protein
MGDLERLSTLGNKLRQMSLDGRFRQDVPMLLQDLDLPFREHIKVRPDGSDTAFDQFLIVELLGQDGSMGRVRGRITLHCRADTPVRPFQLFDQFKTKNKAILGCTAIPWQRFLRADVESVRGCLGWSK